MIERKGWLHAGGRVRSVEEGSIGEVKLDVPRPSDGGA